MIKDMCPQAFPLTALDEGDVEWRVIGWVPVNDPDAPLQPVGVRLDYAGPGAQLLDGPLVFNEPSSSS